MMKRPMCVIGASFSVAMWAAFQFGLPLAGDFAVSAVLLATALLLVAAARWGGRAASAALLSAGLAFTCHAVYVERNITPLERYAGDSVRIEGIVTEMERRGGRLVRYTLQAGFPQNDLPETTVLATHFGESEYAPGDVIEGELRPDEPFTAASARYNRTRGIVLMGILSGSGYSETNRYALDRAVILLRQRLLNQIYRTLPPESAAFVQGMVMGVTDDIPDGTYADMQRSGTSHLLAVSGLHLSVFSGFVLLLLRKTRLGERAQAITALLCDTAFFVMVGFSPSLTRAYTMTVIMLAASFFSSGKRKRGRPRLRSDTLSSLGLAMFLIALLRPQWTLGIGMWLSALSCAGIGIASVSRTLSRGIIARYATGSFSRVIRSCAEAAGVSCAAYLFTMPLLFLQNGWLSLLSPLANLLISPFVPLILAGGMLCAVLPAAWGITGVAALIVHLCVRMVTGISHVISSLPFSTMAFDRAWMLLLLLFLAALLAALPLWGKAQAKTVLGVLLGAAMAFSLGSLVDTLVSRGDIELITIGDTNQTLLLRGSSAVLLTPPDRYNASQLLRYLSFRGVRGVDAVMLPGYGEQIDSGLLRLWEAYEIACIVGPDDGYILELLAQSTPGVPVYPSGYATADLLGGVEIMFGHAGEMRVSCGEDSFLLPPAYEEDGLAVYPEATLLAADAPVRWEPLGKRLFAETRVVLRAD